MNCETDISGLVHQRNLYTTMAALYFTEDIFIPLYFVCITGIIANLMLLTALIRDPLKCFRNSSTYLIGNLCVSDMILPMFIMVIPYTEHLVVEFFIYTLFYSSMLTIFSIAVDRYVITVHPFKHRILMSGRKSALWICANWVLSTIHPVERFLFGYGRFDMIAKSTICLILMALTCIFYAKTYLTLRTQAKTTMDELEGSTGREKFSKQAGNISATRSSFEVRKAREQKFLTTIVIIACISAVTLLPGIIHRQIYRESQMVFERAKDRFIQSILMTIFSVNFAANPFIYYLRLKRYRKTFKIIYCCK